MSASIDLVIEQGSKQQVPLTIYSDAAGQTLADISAYDSATLEVRKSYNASNPVLSLSESTGITILPESSQIIVTFLPSQTSPLKFSGDEADWVYQLEIYTSGDADSTVRLITGGFTLSREIVR